MPHPDTPYAGVPDPIQDSAFYDGVPAKRLLAWVIDTLITTALVIVAIPLSAFTGLFFLPLLWLLVSFAYRTITVAKGGATLGMRFSGIEIRTGDGPHPDAATAAFHSGGYLLITTVFPLLLVSILLMLISDRKQGLHDFALGTVVIKRPQT